MSPSICPSRIPLSCPQHFISAAEFHAELFAQLILQKTLSGFTSPATDYTFGALDLNKYLAERIAWLCIQAGTPLLLNSREPFFKASGGGLQLKEL
jgi:hypothetical protein